MRQKNSSHKAIALIFIVSLSIFSLKAAIGDSLLNGVRIETKLQYGSVFPHHSAVSYVLEDNIQSFEITFSTESNGRHMWESLFRMPRYGLGYNYTNLGNPEVLGDIHAVFGYIDVPFYRSKNKFSFNYQVDFGLSYFTKTYDSYENPLNLIVSSPINVYIGLDLYGRYKIGKNNEIKAGIELTHCSNGKTQTPNLGINMFTLSAAWLYSIKPSTVVCKNFEYTGYKKHFYEFIFNIGGKRDDNMKGDVYMINSLIADYYYAYSPKYSLGLGLDFFHDASLAQHQEFFNQVSPRDNSVNYQYGIHGGFRVRYGRFFLLLNAGGYINASYLKHGNMYSRIGMRYALTDQIMFNLSLKAHAAIADFVEWGIGYRIKTKGK